ncbi:COX15/CtaA family protein [Halomarina oriensis]|uniref:Heme A synthase n=1 Tax=Halomarina oriensis TaxID=671145 RepID=A0A6B0GL82_9EURY|nr:COX15/CtaA family protein [Halomarina oriensis]MWG34209.1 heme A synthase [Halomarina oriensis]
MESRFRTLTALSAGLTFVLVLLGVYTAAAGAGLTCNARWPLCDGAVFGLFPANWPSFIEWFHRLVAMVTGFVILGTTVEAFRGAAGRKTKGALALATLFLPAQIVLGALTVTQYEWAVLTAHFVTATTIFAGVVLAALWVRESGVTTRRLRLTTLALPVTIGAMVALNPRTFVAYTPPMQVAYYAVGQAAFAGALALVVWAGRAGTTARLRLPALGCSALLFGLLVVGRQVYGVTGQYLSLTATALALGLALLGWWLVRNADAGRGRSRGVPSDD